MLRVKFFGLVLLVVLLICGFGVCSAVETKDAVGQESECFDVVVYGGTSGGVAAAVQSAGMGKSVILIEPGRHLGGLSSGGLGATDIGNKNAIGGISQEFYHSIYLHYLKEDSWVYEERRDYEGEKRWRGNTKEWDKGEAWWMFEPHVAEEIFRKMVCEADVEVVYGERLDLEKGVEKSGFVISSIRAESGRVFEGRMFIDASYEGDLMAKAGVSYTVGRESNSQYGETLNGVQTKNAVSHQFDKAVDPYVKAGEPDSGLLAGVHGEGPGVEGEGDNRVQAYNFRLCLTDVEENMVRFSRPADYDPLRYELLLRYYEAGFEEIPWIRSMMPNRKTDINNRHAFSSDNIGMNYGYPDADYKRRAEIIAEHENYQKGLMWTLVNNRRVLEKIREEVGRWGLARDEFPDNGNWPHQLYVREARRMVSDYVMTEKNCRGITCVEDSVGLAAYTMDSHNTQRYVDENGHARNEGDVQAGGFGPYPVSYRSIVPREGECSNLFVPVCLSASHIAFGSIRMEPVFMVLGQSAATAACLAIDEGVSVQQLDYQKLRERLLEDRQILEYTVEEAAVEAAEVDPHRFDKEIGWFEEWDSKNWYVEGEILFVGSSSIRGWATRESFPDLKVLNRGFGGAHISDVNYFVRKTVLRYRPEVIVFYAGDNDVAGGKSAERVLGDYKEFVWMVHDELSGTRIVYISIKPSSSRWVHWPEMKKANGMIESFCAEDEKLFYFDAANVLLGGDGRPDDGMFVADKLHLNAKGYKAWTEAIRPVIDKAVENN